LKIQIVVPIALFLLGACSIEPAADFDYAAASLEERQAWLDRQARTMKRSARWALPQGRNSVFIKLTDVETDTARREIRLIIHVNPVPGKRLSMRSPDTARLAAACKDYTDSPLAAQNVRLTAQYRQTRNGGRPPRQLMNFSIDRGRCARVPGVS
jgi:hypothetical protein